ncbi:MAG TPA: hypothetical protein VFI50_13505 [Casimicrobiaceae bacterium]|nr:hypothetical protein [Casimicrobiaceae bacterium]
MPQSRFAAWLRPLLTLVALAGVLSLAACGGGGGAPNNPYQGGVGPLAITPSVATAYSGSPFVFTVTGGSQPYTILSSDQAVLPVVGTLNGNTLVITPNSVGADTPVTLTVRDASGQTTTALITVKPSLLLPASITITGNPNCAASGADLCSGQDGTATVQVIGPAGAPLAGRDVRFDVVQGAFSISSTAAGQPLVQSLTVTTDQNGNATVRLVVPVNAATQVATIRATDLTSGSSVVGQFTIAQFVNGNSVLSVIPTGTTTFTGPDTEHCSNGASATFYIFGGTPPYTVATNFPSAVSITGQPVQRSGGGFTITTNGTCFTGLTFAITDAAGRTLLTPPTASNVFGTAEPPPPTLTVTPNSATINCSTTNNLQFLVTGGTGTFNAALTPSPVGSSVTAGATTNVTIPVSAPGTIYTLNISSGSQLRSVKITCQ